MIDEVLRENLVELRSIPVGLLKLPIEPKRRHQVCLPVQPNTDVIIAIIDIKSVCLPLQVRRFSDLSLVADGPNNAMALLTFRVPSADTVGPVLINPVRVDKITVEQRQFRLDDVPVLKNQLEDISTNALPHL